MAGLCTLYAPNPFAEHHWATSADVHSSGGASITPHGRALSTCTAVFATAVTVHEVELRDVSIFFSHQTHAAEKNMAKVQILVLCAVAATVSVASSVTSKGSNAVEVNVAAITVATIDGDFEDNYNRA
jgi:hypothetical protein